MIAADIEERRIDRPQISWSQFLYELEHGAPHAGKQMASVNRRTVLGGFCRFHGNEAQERAIARFKSIWERALVGGARAVDPSVEPVDGGGNNPEAIFEIGADARREYSRVVTMLEVLDAKHRLKAGTHLERIEFVVIGMRGPTPYAKWRGFGDGGRGVSRGMVEVRGIADTLAEHWNFQTRRR